MKKTENHPTAPKGDAKSKPILKIIILITALPLSFFVLLLLLPHPSYKDGFKSLEDVDAYAKTIPENFKLDTENTIKPDFTSYYNTLKPTWKNSLVKKIVWLLTLVKLAKPPIWSVGFFKHELITATAQREAREFKESFICKILPTTQSKIVLFGNVQGAFHSLSRCLHKIKELGIIGSDLKISSPDNFIIFTGDIINRSPYTLETLSLVIKLAYVNPDNVLYLRGNHESENYWQEHTLKTELQIRAAHLGTGIIPLADEVNKFFNTLPIACYISMLSDAGTEFIRISDSGRGQNELLNENSYTKFLTSKIQQRLTTFNLKDKKDDAAEEDAVDIKVIIKGEKKRDAYQPHEGLRLLAPDMESTAWTTLACPTPVYQKAIKFIHDAFILLTPAKNLDEWKITLYNRNVQTQEPFKATTFYLLSGVEEGGNNQDKKADKKEDKPKEDKPKQEKTKTPKAPAKQKDKQKKEEAPESEASALVPEVPTKAEATPPAQKPKAKSSTPKTEKPPESEASALVPETAAKDEAKPISEPEKQATPEPEAEKPASKPTPTKSPSKQVPAPAAQETPATLDATTTATIAQHAESISKHLQALAREAQAIAKQLSAQPSKQPEIQKQQEPEEKNPSKAPAKEPVEQEEKSGFEPIAPQNVQEK